MSLDAAIAFFRERERELFRSTCRVTRVGEGGFDPNTGQITPGVSEVIYEGPSTIRSFTWEGSDLEVGGREIRTRGARAKLPADTPVRKDDILEPLTSTHDPGLVGRKYRVTDVMPDDWQIVTRLILEEITGGPE